MGRLAPAYAVELFTAGGVLVHERETAETSLRLSLEPDEADSGLIEAG